ncbi:MAG: cysteine desulfurase family protein [Verrucomicrobiae bacterium]|nr:cysteine desulfurase family protein [Verrucomicrobiae bacterium]
MKVIYCDYNATTPVDRRVASAMWPYVVEQFGNASSLHQPGRIAREGIDKARQQVAGFLRCHPSEVIFTSGGSESNNQAIKGSASLLRSKGNHLIASQIEHPSVMAPLQYLQKQGFEVTFLPVDRYGRVDPNEVQKAITPKTILVSVMHANNETGVIQPIAAIARITREKGVLFHVDGAQAAGKIPVALADLGVDLYSAAGHKFHAPKGIGALFVRQGIRIDPLIHGSEHENGLRAGTENVAGIVGLGAAAEQAACEADSRQNQFQRLRDRLQHGLEKAFGDRIQINGHPVERLPNTLNVSFKGFIGAAILEKIPEIAASTGSACRGQCKDPSPVLAAMGVPRETAMGALRFSLGKENTPGDVDRIVDLLKSRLR